MRAVRETHWSRPDEHKPDGWNAAIIVGLNAPKSMMSEVAVRCVEVTSKYGFHEFTMRHLAAERSGNSVSEPDAT